MRSKSNRMLALVFFDTLIKCVDDRFGKHEVCFLYGISAESEHTKLLTTDHETFALCNGHSNGNRGMNSNLFLYFKTFLDVFQKPILHDGFLFLRTSCRYFFGLQTGGSWFIPRLRY